MKKIKYYIKQFVRKVVEKHASVLELQLASEVVSQKSLMQNYRILASAGTVLNLNDVGFRKHSQFEEDGILLYIFSLIKPVNRTCVEICAGDGRECNTTNLIINHGWWGHLFDGKRENVEFGNRFFEKNKDTFLYPPRFTEAWVTAENVNELIADSGASGPIDVLSLDIDGMDYWVWKSIDVIQPQVVVCETHNPIPTDKALTVPYAPDFIFEHEVYRGASLFAMVKLGREKGYRLIGTHRFGFNAFFMKNGVGEEYFPEIEVADSAQDPYSAMVRNERWPIAKDYDWHDV